MSDEVTNINEIGRIGIIISVYGFLDTFDRLDYQDIESTELSNLWRNVAKSIIDIRDYMEKKLGDDFSWNFSD